MLNNELKNKEINILCGDILYKEGIIEYLEKNINADFIVLDDELPGNIDTDELIEKERRLNRKIRIILITNNKNKSFNVYRKVDKVDVNNIASIIKNQGNVFNMQTIPINDFFEDETKDGKIYTILGANGIGKSIFSIIFSNNIKDGKVLIIDFDVFNNSMINLLGLNKDIDKQNIKQNKSNEELDISDFIVRIENNIDYLLSMNLIFNSELQISCTRIRNIISKLKMKYDYIIIDTSAESLIEYTKEVTKISDEIIFISGANLLEIKKSKRLLDIYEQEWNIPNNKIKIIFNKYTKESLDDNVLRELFRNYEIVGKIRLSNYYDLAINKNNTKRKEIQNEVKNIGRKIVKVKVLRRNRKSVWNKRSKKKRDVKPKKKI